MIDLVIAGVTNGQWGVNSGGSWSTQTNWSGNNVPGGIPQDSTVFGTVLTSGTAYVALDASRSLSSLAFSTTGANSYVIARATAASDPVRRERRGDAQRQRRQPHDRRADHARQQPERDRRAGSMLTVSGAIGESYPGTALSLSGGGTLVLAGVNAYSGPTTIAAGTLQLGNAAALQNSTAILSGGYLDLNGLSATLGGLSGAGNLPIAAGTLAVGNNGAGATYSAISAAAARSAKSAAALVLTAAPTPTPAARPSTTARCKSATAQPIPAPCPATSSSTVRLPAR